MSTSEPTYIRLHFTRVSGNTSTLGPTNYNNGDGRTGATCTIASADNCSHKKRTSQQYATSSLRSSGRLQVLHKLPLVASSRHTFISDWTTLPRAQSPVDSRTSAYYHNATRHVAFCPTRATNNFAAVANYRKLLLDARTEECSLIAARLATHVFVAL